MNNNQGIIINPTKSNKMIQSPQVSIANTNDNGMSLGLTKAVSNGIMDLAMAYQKLKDFQSKSYGLSFEATVDEDVSNFMLEMQTNKDIYKNGDAINGLKSKIEDRIATYKKTALEQGYETEYADAFEARIRGKLQNVENNYLAKNYEYQQKVTLDNYVHSQEMSQQNNERYMALGDYNSALAGTHQVINNMIEAGNAGIIDMAKVAVGIKGVWKGNFNAFGLSLINKPNAQDLLDRYSEMTAGEFFEEFKNFNTKINGEDFMLGADEYEEFKRGISQAQAQLDRAEKVEKQMTWIEQQKLLTRSKTEPFLVYAELNNLPANYDWQVKDYVGVNNIYYGTNFSTLQEFYEAGLQPIYQSKGVADFSALYNDPNAGMEVIMGNRNAIRNQFVGGMNKEIQNDYLDSTDKGNGLGSLATNAYYNNAEFYSVMNGTYSPNKRIASSTFNKEVIDTSVVNLNQYQDEAYEVVTELDPATGEYFDVKKKIQGNSPDIGAKYNSLIANARKGDRQAMRASEDILSFRATEIKSKIIEDTGGVITEDLAEEAELKDKYIGQPITAQSKDIQQKIYDAFTRENKDFMEELDRKTKVVIDGMTKDFTAVDLGNKGVIFAGKDIDTEKAGKTVAEYLQNNSFYIYATNEKGEEVQLEVPKSSISISNKLGDNRLVLEYGGKNLIDKEGKPQILNLDITTKPKVAKIETISSQTQNEKFEKEVVKVIAQPKMGDVTVPRKKYENVIKSTMNEIMEKDNGVVKHDSLLKLVSRKELPDLMKKDLVEKTELLLESPFLNEEPVYLDVEPLEIKIEPILSEEIESVSNKKETPKIKKLNVSGGELNFVDELVSFVKENIKLPTELPINFKNNNTDIKDSNTKVDNKAFLDDKVEIKNNTDNSLKNVEIKELVDSEETIAKKSLSEIAKARYSGKGQGVVPSDIMDKLLDKENLPKQVKWFIDEMENNPKTGDKRIKEYHDLVVPKAGLSANANWCATSLLSSFIETGTEIKHKTASAQQVYKNKKADVSIDKAKAGNVMVFRNRDKNGKRTWTGHVNMVVYKDDDYIVAIGGNQSTENSNERNGVNYINYKVYSVKKLKDQISKKDLSIIEI